MFAFALFVLDTKIGAEFFDLANRAVEKLLDYAKAGATFVFGSLVDNNVPVGTPAGPARWRYSISSSTRVSECSETNAIGTTKSPVRSAPARRIS